MSYSTPAAPQLDALDDLASRYVDVDAMPWTDLPFEGVQAKVLLRDEHGVRTALVRMAPGAAKYLFTSTPASSRPICSRAVSATMKAKLPPGNMSGD